MPAITSASDIERKSHVPDEHRTPARDEVAQFIEEEILAADAWPVSMVKLAERTGYSRSHVTTTLEKYFEAQSGPDRRVEYAPGLDVRLELPDDLTDAETEAYVRGWVQGWHRAHGSE
jgi:AraC-like DNA-binding protein